MCWLRAEPPMRWRRRHLPRGGSRLGTECSRFQFGGRPSCTLRSEEVPSLPRSTTHGERVRRDVAKPLLRESITLLIVILSPLCHRPDPTLPHDATTATP